MQLFRKLRRPRREAIVRACKCLNQRNVPRRPAFEIRTAAQGDASSRDNGHNASNSLSAINLSFRAMHFRGSAG
jgi:hypothetical protein